MRIRRIYTGNWFPRTEMHLKEYYQFITEGTSLLPIDPVALKAAQKDLAPTRVSYVGLATEGRFDRVKATIHGIKTAYFEDGLFIAEMDVKRMATDFRKLHTTYDGKILSALELLFSVGLPALATNDPCCTNRTTVVIVTGASERDATSFLTSQGDKAHLVTKHEGHDVSFGDRFIIVNTEMPDDPLTVRLVRSLLFFREFESRLNSFLNLHRTVWQAVEAIRSKQTLALKDLPTYRDQLLDFDRDLSIVVARLGQMEYFLDERKLEIDEFGHTAYFRALEAYRFGKMHTNINYLLELWTQLHQYLQSSADIIGLMYQDNLQKSVDVLQFIFLIGSVASVIVLGNLTGSDIVLKNAVGELVATGTLNGFGLQSFFLFGGLSILVSVIFFLGSKLFTSSFQRVATSSILGQRKPFGYGKKER